MRVSKETVQRLAEAWLAEAKRLRSGASCDCGCGKPIDVGHRARFKPGHDAKLLSRYRKDIQEILNESK